MRRALLCGAVAGAVLGFIALRIDLYAKANRAPGPAKTETLKCIRVKEVGADAQIIYKCEVPNGRP